MLPLDLDSMLCLWLASGVHVDGSQTSENAREPRPYDEGYVSSSKARAFEVARARPAPVVVLMSPYDPGNIGSASRAMLNFGVSELRVVLPHHPTWNEGEAVSRACGAVSVLKHAVKYNSLRAATADLMLVFATTARPRDMSAAVSSPQEAAAEAVAAMRGGSRVGFLFGSEKSGLRNEDVAFANVLVTIPSEPNFSSLNLAHSVLLISYEWSLAAYRARLPGYTTYLSPLPAQAASMRPVLMEMAPIGQVSSLFAYWEGALWKTRFFGKNLPEPSWQAMSAAISAGEEPLMGEDNTQAKALLAERKRAYKTMLKLRQMIMRSKPTQEEVKLLRGALRALVEPRATRPPRPQNVLAEEGTEECDGPLRQRRLQTRGDQRTWIDEWHARFNCWWHALPLPTQHELSMCIGALAVHLGSRLEAARAHMQSPSRRSDVNPFLRDGAAEPECDWMDATWLESAPNFPEFPPFGEHFELHLPPIPRLIPPLQHLNNLGSLNMPAPHLTAQAVLANPVDAAKSAGPVLTGAILVSFAATLGIYFVICPLRPGVRAAWRQSPGSLSRQAIRNG